MDLLRQSLRFALRALTKSPAVSLLVVGSLTLAIAGNTMVFSLVNGLLYRPLPYEEPHRLSLLSERPSDQPEGLLTPMSAANLLDVQDAQTSYTQLAGFRAQPMSLDRGDAEPEQLAAAAVSPEFFSVLGAQALRGRTFLADEGVPGRDQVVVLSHDQFVERFGGTGAVGSTMKLNGEFHQVVGVMPEDFEFLDPSTELWVPLALDPARIERHERDLLVIGRLAPGVTDEVAQAEMTALMARLETEYPEANRGYLLDIYNLREEIPDPRNRLFLHMMQGALLFVLLIACANIANLLLARSQARQREMAVRSSLGAARGQLVVQLLMESLVMAGIAGLVGLGLAVVGVRLIATAFAAQLPSFYMPVIDGRVLAYTVAVTLFGGVVFGLAPMVQTFRLNLVGALKDGSRGSTLGGRRKLLSSALVVAELSLALIFLAGAGVLLRSFEVLQGSDPGFDTEELLTIQMTLPLNRYGTDVERIAAVDELGERLGALPGVEAVLVSNTLPRHIFVPRDLFDIDASPTSPDQPPRRAQWLTAGPGYFETLGIAVESGRGFTDADGLEGAPVAVVNRSMVERHWGGNNPVGERLTLLGGSREIVGVVEDVRHGLLINDDLAPTVYLPYDQQAGATVGLSLRTAVEPSTLGEAVRKVLRDFDRDVAVAQVQVLDDFIEQFWVGQKLFTLLLRGFGGLALVLAALGTYGVLAYAVAQRRHEIGVRMALGASRRSVEGMVLRQGLKLAVLGILLGIPGVIVVNRAIASIMADFVPVEPGIVVVGMTVLFVVTLLASYLPARRASGTDPMLALRAD
ncbi:MAG: ABC transporter permease [Acidobacteriota bacterium]